MNNQCQPGCGCGNGSGSGSGNPGTSMSRSPQGRSVPLCWGIAGATTTIAAGATTPLTVTVANYAWLKPRSLRIMAADPAIASDVGNPAALLNVDSITGLGRQVIGSAAGVNGGALDAYADRSLVFGADIAEITAANTIVVTITNNGAATLRVSVAIEGEAQQ